MTEAEESHEADAPSTGILASLEEARDAVMSKLTEAKRVFRVLERKKRELDGVIARSRRALENFRKE
jgi:hypothetical protein